MLARWDTVKAGRHDRPSEEDPKFQKKLRERILKGIPNRMRGQVWFKLSRGDQRELDSSIYDTVPLLLPCFL